MARPAAPLRDLLSAFVRVARWAVLEHRDKLRQWSGRPRSSPLMRYREAEVVSGVLKVLEPRRCLEWGAGASTLVFPRLLPPGASWVSIEHDAAWADRVSGRVSAGDLGARVRVRHVPPRRYPWTDPAGDGAPSDLAEYIACASSFAPLEFILVDGRARVGCVRAARELLHPEGCVILHDANRPHYHAAFDAFPRSVTLLDHRTRKGGLLLAGIQRDPRELLDWERCRRAWALCRVLGRVVRC